MFEPCCSSCTECEGANWIVWGCADSGGGGGGGGGARWRSLWQFSVISRSFNRAFSRSLQLFDLGERWWRWCMGGGGCASMLDCECMCWSCVDDSDLCVMAADMWVVGDVTMTGLSLMIDKLLALRSWTGCSYVMGLSPYKHPSLSTFVLFPSADGMYCVFAELLLLSFVGVLLRQRPRIFSNSPPCSTSFRMSLETVASPLYMYWISIWIERLLNSGGSTM